MVTKLPLIGMHLNKRGDFIKWNSDKWQAAFSKLCPVVDLLQNQPRGLLKMPLSRLHLSHTLRMLLGGWSLRSLWQISILYRQLLDSNPRFSKIYLITRICDSGSGTVFAVDKMGNFQQII